MGTVRGREGGGIEANWRKLSSCGMAGWRPHVVRGQCIRAGVEQHLARLKAASPTRLMERSLPAASAPLLVQLLRTW